MADQKSSTQVRSLDATETACPFCRLLPPERRRPNHTAASRHTIPVEIQALPGATFRTTKYEVAEGATQAGRAVRATPMPTGGLYAKFMAACRKAEAMLAAAELEMAA